MIAGTVDVQLMEGSTVIYSETIALSTSFVTTSISLTEEQISSVTDWNNLQIWFLNAEDPSQYVQVSWAQFEVPDGAASSGPGLEMGMVA